MRDQGEPRGAERAKRADKVEKRKTGSGRSPSCGRTRDVCGRNGSLR